MKRKTPDESALIATADYRRNLQQVVEELVQVPWGHHSRIIDNCKGDARKALFYVRMTLAEGWSRSRLEDKMDSGLYDRKGKALDNFRQVLPSAESKVVRELVKSPYLFGLTESIDAADCRNILCSPVGCRRRDLC